MFDRNVKLDFFVENGWLVNVLTGEVLENRGIGILGTKICFLEEGKEHVGGKTCVIDASDKYVVPGFIDGHIHVESSFLSLSEFARIAVLHGTTSVFVDPHEIGNVLGVRGVKLMVNESRNLPLKVFFEIPSCVPSTRELETSGAEITIKDVKNLLKKEEFIGLAEVMDVQGVLNEEKEVLGKILAAKKERKIVEGHAPGLRGKDLSKYVFLGVESDHESISGEEAVLKLRMGMWVEVREGSVMKNMENILKFLLEKKVSLERCMFVCDDRDIKDLFESGYLDHVLRRGVKLGLDPIESISMVTIHPAARFKLDHVIGSISPGRYADLVILKNLKDFEVETVLANGELVVFKRKLLLNYRVPKYPKWALETVKVKKKLYPQDFQVLSPSNEEEVGVHVIKVSEGEAYTEKVIKKLEVSEKIVLGNPEEDIAYAGVIERHGKTGDMGKGFVKGFNLHKGALATSIAHDSHNIIVIGTNLMDMASAANKIIEMNGGMAVSVEGKVTASVELKLAGLMSLDPYEKLYGKLTALLDKVKVTGCTMKNPFTVMSFLSLPVIPELRLTNKGLVDVNESKIISLFV